MEDDSATQEPLSPNITQQEIIVPAKDDQFPLRATLFKPKASSNDAAAKIFCVISSATGVKRSFYFPYATFLCEQYGFTAICFDYRGIGDSKPSKTPVDVKADIVDWCRRDVAGVFEWVFSNYPEYTVVNVGHSVGAHALAIMYPEINTKIARVLTISANLPYLRNFKWNSTYLLTLFTFYLARPLFIAYYGFFPAGTLFGIMEDLPSDIAKQWAWWMKHKDYFVTYGKSKLLHPEGFQSLKAPILSLSFDNDNIATEKQFDDFHRRFINSDQISRQHYKEYKCGHMNFFRKPNMDKPSNHMKLWGQTAQFLLNGAMPADNQLPPSKL